MEAAWSSLVSWCKRGAWAPKPAGWSSLNVAITSTFHDNDKYEVNINLRYMNTDAKVERTTSFDFTFPVQDYDLIKQSRTMLKSFQDVVVRRLKAVNVHQSHHPYIIPSITMACHVLVLIRSETHALSYVLAIKEQPQIILSPKKNVESLLAALGVIIKSSTSKARQPCCCAICLEDIAMKHDDRAESEVAELKRCSHVYHVHCFVQWVLKCGIVATSCPLCRAKLFVRYRIHSSFYFMHDLKSRKKITKQ